MPGLPADRRGSCQRPQHLRSWPVWKGIQGGRRARGKGRRGHQAAAEAAGDGVGEARRSREGRGGSIHKGGRPRFGSHELFEAISTSCPVRRQPAMVPHARVDGTTPRRVAGGEIERDRILAEVHRTQRCCREQLALAAAEAALTRLGLSRASREGSDPTPDRHSAVIARIQRYHCTPTPAPSETTSTAESLRFGKRHVPPPSIGRARSPRRRPKSS